MLNILSLNYEFPPIGGGGGNAHRHILKEFTRFDDIRLTLITTTIQTNPYMEEYSKNSKIYYLPIPKQDLFYWRRSEVFRYLITHYGFLKEYLKSNEFDLCHAFFGFPSGLLAYWNRKRFPYLISIRGSDVPGYNKRFSLDYVLLNPILKRIYHHAEKNVANSTGLSELFHRQFPALHAEVIPNGVDVDFFTPMDRKERTERWIVTSARLIPRKGIDLFMNACREIHNQGIPFHGHIIGDGPEQENLKAMATQFDIHMKVTFHGRMEREALARFLPQCDLFVLPSYAEGMSNAALEAMACGLPLILTDTGGSRELIESNGRIVPVGDSETLTNAIADLLTHPELLRDMGRISRSRAGFFSWPAVARQYYDLYYRICENRVPS